MCRLARHARLLIIISGESRLQANANARRAHHCFGFANSVFAIMKNTRSEHGVSSAFEHAIDQMLQIANATGGDDRDAHGIRDRAREF